MNCFYALQSRGDQEIFLDNVNDMLQVFSISVYALFDPGDTFSFVTPLVDIKYYILPNVLHEIFSVSTQVDNSLVVKRVYRGCPSRVHWFIW